MKHLETDRLDGFSGSLERAHLGDTVSDLDVNAER
jgi:hypothetical protein